MLSVQASCSVLDDKFWKNGDTKLPIQLSILSDEEIHQYDSV